MCICVDTQVNNPGNGIARLFVIMINLYDFGRSKIFDSNLVFNVFDIVSGPVHRNPSI